MASEPVVRRTLQSIANMFNKGPWWVDDSMRMWMTQLQDIHDDDLKQGVLDLLKKAKKLPTVANLRDVIEANPTNQVGEPAELKGCRACDNTGQREMARWYWTEIGQVKTITAFRCAAACCCAKGRRLQVGAFMDWRDVVTMWDRHPKTFRDDNGRPAVYHSTADRPHLDKRERYTPEDLERQKARQPDKPTKDPGFQQHLERFRQDSTHTQPTE